jgi:L-lactate dehydrogenase
VFLEKPARENIAVLVLSSDPSDAMVAPYGGRTPVLTPNPIAVGIPAEPDPILIDISTSITTAGRCARLRNEGKRLPGPWLVDNDGIASDDPHVLGQGGAMLPVGGIDHGHKGFALGLMVEALTQGLSGHGRIDAPTEWGASVLVLAFAAAAFGDAAGFIGQVNGIIGRCRAAAPVPGVDSVRIPGENALARKRAALADGVALYPGIYAALEKLAQRFALPPPPAAGR